MEISKDLYQGWDTLDEAIDFFLNLCLELTVLKRLPDPPTDLYINIHTEPDLSDAQVDTLNITLEG